MVTTIRNDEKRGLQVNAHGDIYVQDNIRDVHFAVLLTDDQREALIAALDPGRAALSKVTFADIEKAIGETTPTFNAQTVRDAATAVCELLGIDIVVDPVEKLAEELYKAAHVDAAPKVTWADLSLDGKVFYRRMAQNLIERKVLDR